MLAVCTKGGKWCLSKFGNVEYNNRTQELHTNIPIGTQLFDRKNLNFIVVVTEVVVSCGSVCVCGVIEGLWVIEIADSPNIRKSCVLSIGDCTIFDVLSTRLVNPKNKKVLNDIHHPKEQRVAVLLLNV